MVRDKKKLELATYYRKRGFSYSEISKICGVSKSTLTNWLGRQTFSKKVKEANKQQAIRGNLNRLRLLNKGREKQYQKMYAEAERSAVIEFKHYQHSPLFVAGLSIYLTKGDLTEGRPIRLTSSRPEVQRIFIKFATEFLGLEKKQVSFWLFLPAEVPETVCLKQWSQQLKIPTDQFGRSQRTPKKEKDSPPLRFGVLNTIINHAILKRKLRKWTKLASKAW